MSSIRTEAKVRFWLQADIQRPEIEVRLTPNNGHSEAHAGLPVMTPSGPTGDEVYGYQAYRNSEVSAHTTINVEAPLKWHYRTWRSCV